MSSPQITLTANTWAGTGAAEIFSTMLLESKFLEQGKVTVRPDIQGKEVLNVSDLTVTFKNYADVFSASGGVNSLDEIVLTLTDVSVHEQITYSALRSHFWAYAQPSGMPNKYVPPAFLEAWILNRYKQYTNQWVNTTFWDGTASVDLGSITTSVTAFTGVFDKAIAGSNTTKRATSTNAVTVTGATEADPAVFTVSGGYQTNLRDRQIVTPVGMAGGTWSTINGNAYRISFVSSTTFQLLNVRTGTALDSSALGTWSAGTIQFINQSNVEATMQKHFDAIPYEARAASTIYVNTQVADAMREVQRTNQITSGTFVGQDGILRFHGIEVYEDPFIPFNKIMSFAKEHVYFGTNLMADMNMVQIVDLNDTIASKAYNYRQDFSVCNEIYDNSQVVISYPF